MATEEESIKKTTTLVIVVILLIVTFLLIKPILIAIIFGALLAFIFNPLYLWINKKIKSKFLALSVLGVGILLFLLLSFWFFTPIILKQSLSIYNEVQNVDFVTPLKKLIPTIANSDQFANDVGSVLYSFVQQTVNSFSVGLKNLIINSPTIFLQLLVTFFCFFFLLRDQEEILAYIKSLSPFSKEINKRFFEYSKEITYSVLFGTVIVGIIQGLITGAGFFIFGVANAFLLTFLTLIAGILPILGPALIWVPVAVFLFTSGRFFDAMGIVLFGLVASLSEQLLRPMIVARRTSMNSAVILIGMIGGFFLLGLIGALIGPLIIAYLLILLELYRDKKIPGIIQEASSSN